MSVLIVSSTEDPAGTNIKNCLLKQSNWNESDTFLGNPVYRQKMMDDVIIGTIDDRTIFHENLDLEIQKQLNINLDLIIFVSRHSSKMGTPTLTVHPIGNYGNADFGGKPRTIVPSAPHLMTDILRAISNYSMKMSLLHKVCFEVTHHGPFLQVPTLFAEVGSTKAEWAKIKPAEVIAKSILEVLPKYVNQENFENTPILVGIGGGHYAPRFTDVILEKNVSFGHMIPNYHLESGNSIEDMFKKALDCTPGVSGVYIHRKSLKKSKVSEYKKWFIDNGISVISSKELLDL